MSKSAVMNRNSKRYIYEKRRKRSKIISVILATFSFILILGTAGLSDNNMISFRSVLVRVTIFTLLFVINYVIYYTIDKYEKEEKEIN